MKKFKMSTFRQYKIFYLNSRNESDMVKQTNFFSGTFFSCVDFINFLKSNLDGSEIFFELQKKSMFSKI